MEHLLTLATVERITQSLPFVPSGPVGNKLQEHVQTLKEVVLLPKIELQKIIQPLVDLLNKIETYQPKPTSKSKTAIQKDWEDIAKSKVIVLELLSYFLSVGISNHKLHLPNHFHENYFSCYYINAADERAEITEEEEEELQERLNDDDSQDVTDQIPKKEKKTIQRVKELDEPRAQLLLEKIMKDILTPPKIIKDASTEYTEYEERSKKVELEILFKLSVTNPNLVFQTMDGIIKETMDTYQLKTLQYLNFDAKRLAAIITSLSNAMPKFSRSQQVIDFAEPLRLACWNWIINYNDEFSEFYKDYTTQPDLISAASLFESMWNFSSKKKMKNRLALFPCLTMLLIICPTAMNKIGIGKGSGNHLKLCKELQKMIKSKDATTKNIAMRCLVDMYRASLYLPSDLEEKGLSQFIAPLKKSLDEMITSDYPKKEDGTIDIDLIVDYLIASFLEDVHGTFKSKMIHCFEGPMELKLVLTKAMLALIKSPSLLDRHPRLSSIYKEISDHIQTLFQEVAAPQGKESEEEKRVSTIGLFKKSKPVTVVKTNYQIQMETLHTLLHCFNADPEFFLVRNSTKPIANDPLFKILTQCYLDHKSNFPIQHQSSRLLKKLWLEEYINLWCPKEKLLGFVNIGSNVLIRLSQTIFDEESLHSNHMLQLLSLLRTITFRTKAFFVNNRKELTNEITEHRRRLLSLELLASNLLVCLCSTDRNIWILTTKCLKDICDQIDILQNQNLKYLNYSFYRQLTNVDLKGDINRERKYQIQLFRRIEVQTKSNLTAFNEVYTRWKQLIKDSESRELMGYYTSMLCALGGVCLQVSQDKKRDDVKAKKKETGYMVEERHKLNQFMGDLMAEIVSEDLTIKNMVTLAVATDLAPALYDKLIHNMYLKINSSFGKLGEITITEVTNSWVEQATFILKTILESKEGTYDLALATDFDKLLINLIKYCAKMDRLDRRGINMKHKLCHLMSAVMDKSEYISFQNEKQFRQDMLNQITEWTSDFALKSTNPTQEIKQYYEELNASCLRAIAGLLNGYKIPSDGRDEFLKYFAFLKDALEKYKKKPQIVDQIIKGLGGLLQSNLSFGLEHFMTMVYHPDEDIRSAFLILLARLMKQGFTLEEGIEYDDDEITSVEKEVDKYQPLRDLLFEFNKDIIFILTSEVRNNEKDDLCESLIRIHQKRGEEELLALLKKSVELEVASTNQPGTLFRANSTASKLMKQYCLRVANPWLQDVLKPLIERACKNPVNFEIDPLKAQSRNEDVKKNVENMLQVIQEYMDTIIAKLEKCPRTFKLYCKYLYDEVGRKFPTPDEEFETRHIAVGGFLFLRLICPAITVPQQYGLYDEMPSADARRYFVIVTKVLQNIANGIVDAKKEDFMVSFDGFIKKNLQLLKVAFEKLVSTEQEDPMKLNESVTDEELQEANVEIHRYLYNYLEKMRPKLQTLTKKRGENDVTDAYRLLKDILDKMEKPPEKVKARKSIKRVKDDEYESINFIQFMNKMQDKDVSEIEKSGVCYQKGTTKSGQNIIWFVPRFYSKNLDDSLFIYYILKLLEKIWKQPYVVVVDVTFWDSQQEIQFSLLLKLLQYIPNGGKKNLASIIILNPNTYFKVATKPLLPMVRSSMKSWKFAAGIQSLTEFMDEKNIHLPQSTLDAEKQVHTTFSDVQRVTSKTVSRKVAIQISDEMLYIITYADKILSIDATRVDHIHIHRISKVSSKKSAFSRRHEDLVLQYIEHDGSSMNTLRFRSPDRERIIQAINSVIARQIRLGEVQKLKKMKKEKKLSPNDVPGQLLNICFLNMMANDAKTRFAAYNLLSYLILKFNLPITDIVESEVVVVPHNTSDLVQKMTTKIAEKKPDLTLEFLLEALNGFQNVSPKSQSDCIQYIKPWIKNLFPLVEKKEEVNENRMKKLHEFMNQLTHISCRFRHTGLYELWSIVAENHQLLSIGLDCLLKYGLEGGIQEKNTKAINDILITLAVFDSKLISTKIIESIFVLLLLLNSEFSIKDLTWSKIVILSRYLMQLSFQNRLDVLNNLPNLIFIIISLVGTGNAYIRSTIHALTANIIHSLSTIADINQEERQQIVKLSQQLIQPKLLIIYMGSINLPPEPFQDVNKAKDVTDHLNMIKIEELGKYFSNVMTSIESQSYAWIESFKSICKNALSNGNVFLYPRVLAAYSVIIPRHSDEMIPFVLDYLRKQGVKGFDNADLIVATMSSIIRFMDHLSSSHEKLLNALFILGLTIIPSCNLKIYSSVVNMLNNVCTIMYEGHHFAKYESLNEFFITNFRDDETYSNIVASLEKSCGISFKEHLSFAISVLLMKGLSTESTREPTLELLKNLLFIANNMKVHTSQSLGFITGLLPFEKQFQNHSYYEQLFVKENFEHPKGERVFLFQKYLFTLVQELTEEDEILAVYTTLMKAFEASPATFEDVFKDHASMTQVVKVYTHSTNEKIIECGLSLFKSMSKNEVKLQPGEPFEECGFSGFRKHTSFKKLDEKIVAETRQHAIDLLSKIVTKFNYVF